MLGCGMYRTNDYERTGPVKYPYDDEGNRPWWTRNPFRPPVEFDYKNAYWITLSILVAIMFAVFAANR